MNDGIPNAAVLERHLADQPDLELHLYRDHDFRGTPSTPISLIPDRELRSWHEQYHDIEADRATS